MRILILLIALIPSVLVAAEVYRWVDDDGTVHYSDRPQEGAETVIIQEAQTFSTPARQAASSTSTTTNDAAPEDAASYSNFEIVSPRQEEVLWNIGGQLNVSLRARPRIRSGHTIFLFMDGQEVQQLPRGRTMASLTDVVRGTHQLHAEVRDRSGSTVARSDTVQFTVQQTSIQNPNNPNRPGGGG
ncbi:MAG: DUF4124 domain-containing protein [Gammaproteobacteria bacterium]|nr:DUF4124 domain-containing protein [Gammaproteobacteria bacterium]MBT8445465.1 DUF4124 domain-containing protein [Gammaproteobacteria bacterium]NND36829.1 DUF4124 domain-containing protein [Gammaproteobacteria bacterium]